MITQIPPYPDQPDQQEFPIHQPPPLRTLRSRQSGSGFQPETHPHTPRPTRGSVLAPPPSASPPPNRPPPTTPISPICPSRLRVSSSPVRTSPVPKPIATRPNHKAHRPPRCNPRGLFNNRSIDRLAPRHAPFNVLHFVFIGESQAKPGIPSGNTLRSSLRCRLRASETQPVQSPSVAVRVRRGAQSRSSTPLHAKGRGVSRLR